MKLVREEKELSKLKGDRLTMAAEYSCKLKVEKGERKTRGSNLRENEMEAPAEQKIALPSLCVR